MSDQFPKIQKALSAEQRRCLVNGKAYFFGWHLLVRPLGHRTSLEALEEACRIGEICYSLVDIGRTRDLLGKPAGLGGEG